MAELDRAEVYTKIQGIISEVLGVDKSKVVETARFREELEADSLDLVELIMAFEENFNAEISDEDAQTITTVAGAVDYIMARAKA
jgi:acyl carrier protein